jgi:hypothetical protein
VSDPLICAIEDEHSWLRLAEHSDRSGQLMHVTQFDP